jgi:hypothetical protein
MWWHGANHMVNQGRDTSSFGKGQRRMTRHVVSNARRLPFVAELAKGAFCVETVF